MGMKRYQALTQQAKSQGFTLIELIMVIVILGILSAFALPKFADFTGDAETSSIEGARGTVRSASAISHAACLATDSCDASVASGETVSLEGVTIDMVLGYPTADASATNGSICEAAGIEGGDYTCATSSGDGTADNPRVMTITLAGSTCNFTYTEPDSDGDPAAPSVSTIQNCP